MTERLIVTTGFQAFQSPELNARIKEQNSIEKNIRWLWALDKVGFESDNPRTRTVLIISHNIITHSARVFVLGGESIQADGHAIRAPSDTTASELKALKFILSTRFPEERDTE